MARLTVREAAEYLRLAISTLNHMRTAGKGPQYSKLGTRIIYDTRDLDAWFDKHKRRSTSDQPELRRPRRRSRNLVDASR